jgi:hypothetical protein
LVDEVSESRPLELELADHAVPFGFGQSLSRDIAENADRHANGTNPIEHGRGLDGEPTLGAGRTQPQSDDTLRYDSSARGVWPR